MIPMIPMTRPLLDDAECDAVTRVLRNHGQAAPGVFERHAGNFRLTELGGALGGGAARGQEHPKGL